MAETRSSHLMLDTLPLEEAAWIKRHVVNATFAPGKTLCTARMPIPAIVFITDGIAGQYVEHVGGTQIEVAINGPQSLIGSTALLGDGLSPLTVTVLHPAAALLIQRPLFPLLSRMTPILCSRIGHAALDDQLRLAEAVARQAFSSARSRVAHRLLARFEIYATDCLDITHDALAAALALRRATVTVALQQLEEAHAIRSRRGNIELLNAERLADLASL